MSNEIRALPSSDQANVRLRKLGRFQVRERSFVALAVTILIALGILDAIEDVLEQQTPWALFVDGLYILFGVAVLVFLYQTSPLYLRRRNTILTKEIIFKHKDSLVWRERAAQLLSGLGEVIDQQFTEWNLTDAEKSVGLLILKGLSLKEIAEVRDTTERTVRQQASIVYSKAGLSGRAELSAFFLEDLLLPSERPTG